MIDLLVDWLIDWLIDWIFPRDHAGGNKGLLDKVSGLRVLGGDERIHGVTERVQGGEEIQLGGLQIRCIDTPCHTTGTDTVYVHLVILILGGGRQFFNSEVIPVFPHFSLSCRIPINGKSSRACEPGSQRPDRLKAPTQSHSGRIASCVAVGSLC